MIEQKERNKIGNRLMIIGVVLALIAVGMISAKYILTDEQQEQQTDPEYTAITTYDLENGNVTGFTMVDVRTEELYNQSHIGGAVHVYYGCSSCFVEEVDDLNITNNIVLYGTNSYYAMCKLYENGYRNLYILTDYERWVN